MTDLEHLKEIMELRFNLNDKALELQAKETERRLENLNHEAEQLKSMQSTYMPREVYEAKHKELTAQINSISKLVYIGVGIAVVSEIVIGLVIRFIKI